MEDIIDASPTELIESPKVGRKLPEVLSIDEINGLGLTSLGYYNSKVTFGHKFTLRMLSKEYSSDLT